MQFKKSAVFGVLIMLYLSTDSCCHYIPEKKTYASARKTGTGASPTPQKIQICGSALTNFILESCNGIVESFDPADPKRSSARSKLTEDCCEKGCPLDYIQTYCGEDSLFVTNKGLRGRSPKKPAKKGAADPGAAEGAPLGGRKKGVSEVSVRGKNHGQRKPAKSRKKRKKSFKWKCAYESFGHFLLRLDRRGRARHAAAKESATPARTWPSIEVGTVSPELDKFGGQPIVVVKRNKWNYS